MLHHESFTNTRKFDSLQKQQIVVDSHNDNLGGVYSSWTVDNKLVRTGTSSQIYEKFRDLVPYESEHHWVIHVVAVGDLYKAKLYKQSLKRLASGKKRN